MICHDRFNAVVFIKFMSRLIKEDAKRKIILILETMIPLASGLDWQFNDQRHE